VVEVQVVRGWVVAVMSEVGVALGVGGGEGVGEVVTWEELWATQTRAWHKIDVWTLRNCR
jgi:hypothetical protein